MFPPNKSRNATQHANSLFYLSPSLHTSSSTFLAGFLPSPPSPLSFAFSSHLLAVLPSLGSSDATRLFPALVKLGYRDR